MSYAYRAGLHYTKKTANQIYRMWSGDGKVSAPRPRNRSSVSRPTFAGGAPVAYSSRQRARLGQGRRHVFSSSELIGDVPGSIAYTCTKYALNPGLTASFPRLAREAAVWQHYRFTKLRYRFVTRTGTGTVGSVILSPSYNPAEPSPADEKEASNTQDSVEDVSWSKEIVCNLKPASMHATSSKKQIRYFNVPGDYNLYDCGNMYVCTKGQVGTDVIGKLWVDYTIEFFVPQSIPTNPEPRELTWLVSDLTGPINTAFNKDFTWPQPTASNNPLGLIVDSVTPKDMSLPLGTYLIIYEVTADVDALAGQDVRTVTEFCIGVTIFHTMYTGLMNVGQSITGTGSLLLVINDPTTTFSLRIRPGAGVNPVLAESYCNIKILNV